MRAALPAAAVKAGKVFLTTRTSVPTQSMYPKTYWCVNKRVLYLALHFLGWSSTIVTMRECSLVTWPTWIWTGRVAMSEC